MKIAVTGKGGVGKTTLSSTLCRILADEGKRVLAVDADPDANLGAALGIPEAELASIRPIAELPDLIEERTGARPGKASGVFKLNPRVDDIPEGFGKRMGNIIFLPLGKHKEASSGCYCPEGVLLRRLLKHMVVERDEAVILDMEAGIEHMTRGTLEAVDAFIVVVEPGLRSIQTARTVSAMASDMGVKNVLVVANKVRSGEDEKLIRAHIGGLHYAGSLAFSGEVMEADLRGVPPYEGAPALVESVRKIKNELEAILARG